MRSDIARDRLPLECRRCRYPRRDHDFLFGPQFGRPYCVMVVARRILHLRFNDLSDRKDTARHRLRVGIRSDVPIIEQHNEDGLPPRRDRAVVDDRPFRGLTTVKVTILWAH